MYLFVFCLFLTFIVWYDLYQQFFNFNDNPYYILTSFSDITNPTYHNFNNLVCRIGFIRINICPSSNTMNKTGIIITTLHRVNGIQLPWVILSTTLSTFSFIYSFSWTTIRRINWLAKEEELERWIQNLEDLKSHKIFQIQNHYSIF